MAEEKSKGDGKKSITLKQRLDFFEQQMRSSLAACLTMSDRSASNQQIDTLVEMLEPAQIEIQKEYADQLKERRSGEADDSHIAQLVGNLRVEFANAKKDFPRAVPPDQKDAKAAATGASKKSSLLSAVGNWSKKKGDEKSDAKIAEIEKCIGDASTLFSKGNQMEETQHQLLCALDKVLYLPTNISPQTSAAVLSLFTPLFERWALPDDARSSDMGYEPYELAPRSVILAHLRLYVASLRAWEIAPQHAALIGDILAHAGAAQASFQSVYSERSSGRSPGDQLDRAIDQSYREIHRAMQGKRLYAARPCLAEDRSFKTRERPSDFGEIFLNEPPRGAAAAVARK